MINKTPRILIPVLLPLLLLLTLFSVSQLSAQDSFDQFKKNGGFNSGLGDLLENNDLGSDSPVTFSAYYKMKPDSREGYIYLKAELEPTWHIYSQTQKSGSGAPGRSIITLEDSDEYKLIGNWQPDHPPHIKPPDDDVDVEVEEFGEQVIWSAPFEFTEGVNVKDGDLNIKYKGQRCDPNGCLPFTERLVANYDDEAEIRGVVREEVKEVVEEKREKKAVAETAEQQAEIAKLYDPATPIKYEKLDGTSGQGTFWAALLGAFLGGMILNLMPCVFPVLGIKVLGFVEQAGSDPKKIRMHGLAFAGGLIFSMWVLAAFILTLKFSLGQEVSWGQQMGYPIVVGGIVMMLFVLGLNLAGVFEMGLFMTRVGGKGAIKGKGEKEKSHYTGSFVSGIITTIVATPCSGPFLGTAMGYTLAQPPALALLLFTVFGLGIAVPYLILSFVPALINLLPKPGEWMETFKKLMAFTMFGAAAFFVQAFGSQTGSDGLSWFLMALCVVSLAAYFYGKWSPVYVEPKQRYLWGWAAPAVIAGVGILMYVQASNMKGPKIVSDEWMQWIPGRVEQQLALGKPVWVDYTADW